MLPRDSTLLCTQAVTLGEGADSIMGWNGMVIFTNLRYKYEISRSIQAKTRKLLASAAHNCEVALEPGGFGQCHDGFNWHHILLKVAARLPRLPEIARYEAYQQKTGDKAFAGERHLPTSSGWYHE